VEHSEGPDFITDINEDADKTALLSTNSFLRFAPPEPVNADACYVGQYRSFGGEALNGESCGIAGRLQVEGLVKFGHFDHRFFKLRRELLHCGFLPMGEERTPGASMLMPFQ
jgi:hypothetical protein